MSGTRKKNPCDASEAPIDAPLIHFNVLRRERGKSVSAAELAAAAAALRECRGSSVVVPILLRLLRDPRPTVRIGAIQGLSLHPVRAASKRLADLETRDPSAKVRAAATEALKTLATLPVLCIQCQWTEATIALEPSGDPHDSAWLFPVFCSTECQLAYAADAAREAINGGDVHHCDMPGEWRAGDRDRCTVCTAADVIGETSDLPPDEEVALEKVLTRIPMATMSKIQALMKAGASPRSILEPALRRYLATVPAERPKPMPINDNEPHAVIACEVAAELVDDLRDRYVAPREVEARIREALIHFTGVAGMPRPRDP